MSRFQSITLLKFSCAKQPYLTGMPFKLLIIVTVLEPIPGSTGYKAGVHPGLDARPLQGTYTHTLMNYFEDNSKPNLHSI